MDVESVLFQRVDTIINILNTFTDSQFVFFDNEVCLQLLRNESMIIIIIRILILSEVHWQFNDGHNKFYDTFNSTTNHIQEHLKTQFTFRQFL